jgi:hypothetical protein
MKEKPMYLYIKINKPIRILLSFCLASLLLTALVGFQEFKQDGVVCKFRARIVDVQKSPGTQFLVVKELLTTKAMAKDKEGTIDVLVTSETISRSGDRILKFNDFRVGMLIEIEGLKIIEREDGKDYTVVQAQRIRQLVG